MGRVVDLMRMTQPRQIVPGRTYLITRRTSQRQFLLRPDERTNQIVRYCLAEAAARYGLEVHVFLVMSNHYHIEVTDVHGVLPQFLRHLNLMLARALNVRWSRWENLWSVEQACATWLVDDEDKLAKGVYSLVNPTVDHLVERVEDWPGASSWHAHAYGQTMMVDRPAGFFRDGGRMPEQVELKVVPPRRASGERWPLEDWHKQLVSAVRSSEQASMVWRRRQGMTVLGRRSVRKQSAFEGPKTHEPRRRLRPALACRSRERRIQELGALCAFRRLHRSASQALLSGDRAAVFPAGTWAQRSLCQSCQPPPAAT
jgi:putative transposase